MLVEARLDDVPPSIGWAVRALAELGLPVVGGIRIIRTLPWSSVFLMPTTNGNIFLKNPGPGFEAEGALLEFLRNTVKGRVTDVLAREPAGGGFLMRDAGNPLRDTLASPGGVYVLAQALDAYASLQIATAGRTVELRQLGLKDMSMATMASRLGELVGDRRILREDGAADDEFASLDAAIPVVASLYAELEDCGVPDTLEHGDFNDANILVLRGTATLSDFGDAVIAHPFFSMARFLFGVARHHPQEVAEEARLAVVTSYLPKWSAYGTEEQLKQALSLACRLGPVHASLQIATIWDRITPDCREFFRGRVLGGLRSIVLGHS